MLGTESGPLHEQQMLLNIKPSLLRTIYFERDFHGILLSIFPAFKRVLFIHAFVCCIVCVSVGGGVYSLMCRYLCKPKSSVVSPETESWVVVSY